VLLLLTTLRAPTVSKADGTSSTSPTLIKAAAFPTSPSSSLLTMLSVLLRTWRTGLVITARHTSRPIITARSQRTSQVIPMAGHLLFGWSSITSATSISHCTLSLKSTRNIPQVIRVVILRISLASAVLETYTPFGIPSRITTVVTPSL
jgi:hypothetical protein